MAAETAALEKQFTEECIQGSKELQKKYGYNPIYFLRMVYDFGGVEATRRLLKSENYQDGLYTLWELGQLDSSVEKAVTELKWSALFTEEEKKIARKRLKEMNSRPSPAGEVAGDTNNLNAADAH